MGKSTTSEAVLEQEPARSTLQSQCRINKDLREHLCGLERFVLYCFPVVVAAAAAAAAE